LQGFEMSLAISIARNDPQWVKAGVDAAAAWGRYDKGFGFRSSGDIEYPGDHSLEISLNIDVRPHGNFGEFSNFPLDVELTGDLTDDSAPVGVYAIKQGKIALAVMLPLLKDELELNLDQPIEMDRVVVATGTETHMRMSVSVKVRSAPHTPAVKVSEVDPHFLQTEIGVSVQRLSPAPDPFVEESATVIVFAEGAVVRLSEHVETGEILNLRRLDSNHAAACRVIGLKSTPTAKNYIELEFVKATPGFWGLEFPAAASGKSPRPTLVHKERAPKGLDVSASPARVTPVPIADAPAPATHSASNAPAAESRHPFFTMLHASTASDQTIVHEEPPSAESQAAPPHAAPLQPAPPEPEPPAPVSEAPVEAEPTPGPVAVAEPVIAEVAATHIVEQPAPSAAEPEITPADAAAPAPEPAPEPVSVAEAAPASSAATPAPLQPAPVATTAPTRVEPRAVPIITPRLPARPSISAAKSLSAKDSAFSGKQAPRGAILSGAMTSPGQPVSSSAPVLSGGHLLGWDARQEKRRRTSSILVWIIVAAAIVGVGIAEGPSLYRWERRTETNTGNTGFAATTEPASSASAPASAPTAAPGAPTSTASPTAGAAPVASSAASSPSAPKNSRGAAQSAANVTPAAPKPRAATPAPPRGAPVAELSMSAPTVAARSTNRSAPAAAPEVYGAVPDNVAATNIGGDLPQPNAPQVFPSMVVSTGVQPPRLLSAPTPDYPVAARTAKVQGDVSVDLLIDENGQVESAQVLSGPTLLREAALLALGKRKYTPATLDGKPVATHIVVTIHFRL
jgi:TonB family protein